MLAAKNFQSGMMMVRQLEFSLFDFELHATHGDGRSVLQVLEGVRDEVSVMRPPAYNRFPTALRTSLLVVMRRATTATSGPRCCRQTPSRALRKKAC